MEFWKTRGKGWTPKYDGDALPKEPIAEVEVAQEWSSPERTQKAASCCIYTSRNSRNRHPAALNPECWDPM